MEARKVSRQICERRRDTVPAGNFQKLDLMKRLPAAKNARLDKTIRILLADNHAVLTDALRLLLDAQRDMKVAACANDGADAVHLASKLHPDVAVLGINMPGINGIEAARQIRKLSPSTRVVILSMYTSPEYVYQAFRAGADGYVVKEASAAELLEALRRVTKGKRYMSDAISSLLIGDITGEPSASQDPLQSLTEREREVLRLTVSGKSSAAAAKTLGLSPKTVESYRSRIMRKLELHDMPSLVKFAIRYGLTSLE